MNTQHEMLYIYIHMQSATKLEHGLESYVYSFVNNIISLIQYGCKLHQNHILSMFSVIGLGSLAQRNRFYATGPCKYMTLYTHVQHTSHRV